MDKKLFSFLSVFIFTILIASCALGQQLFVVSQPDGTTDTTSDWFTIQWTPQYGFTGIDANMMKGVNTVSCYIDGTNTTFSKGTPAFTGIACCDANKSKVFVGNISLDRRTDQSFYVWCINDQNSDMNAYSSGTFTVTRYRAGDFLGLGLDTVGGIIAPFALNAYFVGAMLAAIVIIVFLIDLLYGTFGIIEMFKNMASR